jgi:fatty acid desaturase
MQIPIGGNEGTMADTAQSRQRPDESYTLNRRGRHVHHGRTLAAWAGSAIGLVAFIVGGFAVAFQIWPMFWVAVALAAIALIVTVVLQRMGYGAS